MKATTKEKSQVDKFRDAARALGIDESDDIFEAALAKIAKAPKLTDEEIKTLAEKQREQSRR